MGIYDRDYYRTHEPSGIGRVRMWSVTTWLLILNIAVFILDNFATTIAQTPAGQRVELHPLWQLGAFTIYDGVLHAQIWRAITCQFLHSGFWHIFANMVGLWMFGPIVELSLGHRRYLFFYLLCGIAGPIMYTALWGLGILTPGGPEMLIPSMHTQLLGASAGIFGILVAAAYLAPNRLIYIYFIEMPLKYFAWIMVGIAAYTVLVHGRNAGGQAAHLGGALLGFFLIRHEPLLNVVEGKKILRGKKVKDWSKDMNR
jgi:membrane associated rhomboid family serine protease